MTMRLTALGNTRASNRPYHILTKPMRRMRHIMLFLRSPGLWRAMKARGPEHNRLAWGMLLLVELQRRFNRRPNGC